MDLLLAIRKDDVLLEVPLEKKARVELTARFGELQRSFLGPDTEIHPYAPAFRPEEDGVLKLKFELPEGIWKCRQSLPSDVATLGQDDIDLGIKAVIAVETGKAPSFAFQAIDNRYMLKPQRVAFFFKTGFRFNETTGIVFAARLDAVHRGGFLYFKSELVVRRFLDVEAYFTEATDAELEDLFTGPAFTVADMSALQAVANTSLRRKIHGIIASGRPLHPTTIQELAKRINVKVTVSKGKLVVPTTPKGFREFVRIIDDAYLESLLDRRSVYLTTSKRPVR